MRCHQFITLVFNWRNSIRCTHCNIISLEHDSIPWQAKSQRIDVANTTFHLLRQIFTIIKIFSSRFEMWLSKTSQIWIIYVLWGCSGWYGKFQGDIIQQHFIKHTLSHHCVIWRFIWSHHYTEGIPDTCDGYDLNIDVINNDEYNAFQKESLVFWGAYCIFGFWNSLKLLLYYDGSKQEHVWK